MDNSALPASVGWVNTPVAKARRASHTASASTASPQLAHANLIHKKTDSKATEASFQQSQPPSVTPINTNFESQHSRSSTSANVSPVTAPEGDHEPHEPTDALIYRIKRQLSSAVHNVPHAFSFDESLLSDTAKVAIATLPPLIDPQGGAKRRAMQNKEDLRNLHVDSDDKFRLEEQAKLAAEDALDEDSGMATGSLALGGEPEDNPHGASSRVAIGRPSQVTPTSNIPVDQLSNLNLNTVSTPQQRQHMVNPAPGVASRMAQPPVQSTAYEMSDFDRRGPQYSQAQYDQMSGHTRHGSRYFNNADPKANSARFPTQQQQQPYFSSGVQGPPPGLPTAGTPPVSGGGMFAHGQGFTSTGFGASKDNTEALRARSGTTDQQIKREFLLSPLNSGPLGSNPLRSPPSATAPGVLNGMYGQYPAYQDPNFVKQKRKGKKQRHANTTSSGGGVDHLAADPSILSARVHQGAAGQGVFTGNQGGYNQSNIAGYGSGNFNNNRW